MTAQKRPAACLSGSKQPVLLLSAISFLLLSIGCTTTSVTQDLTASAKSATDAATVVQSVDSEILRARLLKLVDKDQVAMPAQVPPALVCVPSVPSVDGAAKELGAYADAINAVAKVAAKPTDVSYAGYLQQFKKNQAIISAPPTDPAQAAAKEQKDSLEAQAQCKTFLDSDLKSKLVAQPVPPGGSVLTAVEASAVSIDGLLKSILAGAEQVQRDIAIHRATTDMLATIQDATARLSGPPSKTDYIFENTPTPPTSVLTNTLTIHRWFAAQRVQMDWQEVIAASNASDVRRRWQAVDAFASDANSYSVLSKTAPDKLLQGLKDAVAKASQTTDQTSVGEIFDSLAAIGSALSNINSKYASVRKTLD